MTHATTSLRALYALPALAVCAIGCGRAPVAPVESAAPVAPAPTSSSRVYETNKAGDALADKGARPMVAALPGDRPTVRVDVEAEQQTIVGFGGSFTESAASVLAQLEPAKRQEVLDRTFGDGDGGEAGARYSLTRTHIGSCDFSPRGRYAYASKADLSDFSVAEDEDDLLPLILDAQRVSGASFEIIASPWTAPPFMKSGGKGDGWYGGRLEEAHYGTFAEYIARYIAAYRERGVDIWAVTPVNEPLGNAMQWESMHFTPEEMGAFIREALGPALAPLGTKLLIFDQNRAEAWEWVEALLGDPSVARHVYGTAVHWYGSTWKVFGDALDRIREAYPDRVIINTEATADVIWDDPAEWEPPPEVGAQQDHRPETMHYWQNWAWWWEVNATDWGFRWASDEEKPDHPRYAVANRYIRDIVGSLNHGLSGWVDWNLVLDERGGPNHVGNFCGAPIMIDAAAGEVFYTPVYYVLSHFSRFIRPGARVLATTAPAGLIATAARNEDGAIAVVVANIAAEPARYGEVVERAYRLAVGAEVVDLTIPAHAVQTVVVRAPR